MMPSVAHWQPGAIIRRAAHGSNRWVKAARARISNQKEEWLPAIAALIILFVCYLPTLQTIPNGSSQRFMVDVGEAQIVPERMGQPACDGLPALRHQRQHPDHFRRLVRRRTHLRRGLGLLILGVARSGTDVPAGPAADGPTLVGGRDVTALWPHARLLVTCRHRRNLHVYALATVAVIFAGGGRRARPRLHTGIARRLRALPSSRHRHKYPRSACRSINCGRSIHGGHNGGAMVRRPPAAHCECWAAAYCWVRSASANTSG